MSSILKLQSLIGSLKIERKTVSFSPETLRFNPS